MQTIEYDTSKKYATKALEYAKMLIDDAEAGGAKYNTHYMLHMLMFLKSQIIMRTRKPFGNIDGSREMVHMAQVVETTD